MDSSMRILAGLILLFGLSLFGLSAVPAAAESKPDCEAFRALGLTPPPACTGVVEETPAVADKSGSESGPRTRGLAIGTSATPPVPAPARAAEPVRATVPPPPARPAPLPAAATSAAPELPRAKPDPVAALSGAGFDDIRQSLADIRSALDLIRDEQNRLVQEQAELRSLVGDTRMREIGRLDGRIDQMTDLMERMIRHVGSRIAGDGK